MYYIAMDGGGTKLVGLLFDDHYRLLASARADGTHISVYPPEEIRAHIASCYETLFAGLPRPLRIERLYTICGDSNLYAQLLPEGITLGDIRHMTEAVSGLYAGACTHSGFLALSGTGSDVFCIQHDQLVDVIGGWGAILGDEGSGVWMSRMAMGAAIRAEQGWGAPTIFGEMVKEHYGFSHLWDFVNYIYATPSPFRRVGELMPLIAQAADRGDAMMLDVLRQGGILLGQQMAALLGRHPEAKPRITACGGAWKAHPAMAEAFTAYVQEKCPDATFTLPRFEHIMAGPICRAMEAHVAGEGESVEVVADYLFRSWPRFRWNDKA